MYFVYILECADKTFYIGITTDLKRRVLEHNVSKLGAKYTKGRRPVVLRGFEEFPDKGSALKREIAMKKFSRKKKELLCKGKNLFLPPGFLRPQE